MDAEWRAILARQFGATIEMLAQALRGCPDELWSARLWNDQYATFWNIAYHTLFWLDLHLSGTADGFVPPPPFTLDELDPAGKLPDRTFTRDELLAFAEHTRQKSERILAALSDADARRRCPFPWGEPSYAELLIYTLRHAQEHASQLGLLLGQRTGSAPGWVGGVPSEHGI